MLQDDDIIGEDPMEYHYVSDTPNTNTHSQPTHTKDSTRTELCSEYLTLGR